MHLKQRLIALACCNPVLCCTVQEPHVQQKAVTTGLCAGNGSLASRYHNASITIKGLHIASCISQAAYDMICVLYAAYRKQTCCTWNYQSNSSRQNRNHEQLLDNRSFTLHRRCSARPDTNPAVRVKERPWYLISQLVNFARALKPYWPPYAKEHVNAETILAASSWQNLGNEHITIYQSHARSYVDSTSSCVRSAIPAKVLTGSICPLRPQESANARPSVRKSLSCNLQGRTTNFGLVAILRETMPWR